MFLLLLFYNCIYLSIFCFNNLYPLLLNIYNILVLFDPNDLFIELLLIYLVINTNKDNNYWLFPIQLIHLIFLMIILVLPNIWLWLNTINFYPVIYSLMIVYVYIDINNNRILLLLFHLTSKFSMNNI